jgi:hypothetical protein
MLQQLFCSQYKQELDVATLGVGYLMLRDCTALSLAQIPSSVWQL